MLNRPTLSQTNSFSKAVVSTLAVGHTPYWHATTAIAARGRSRSDTTMPISTSTGPAKLINHGFDKAKYRCKVLDDMKVGLVRVQLLRSHTLNSERVVGSVGDHDIPAAVIVRCNQQRVDIREHCMAEFYPR